jgi:hypothetical protein
MGNASTNFSSSFTPALPNAVKNVARNRHVPEQRFAERGGSIPTPPHLWSSDATE